MTEMSAAKVRETFGETLSRVGFGGGRVVIHKHGKPIAALVSLEDLRVLQALEDRIDLEAAREALAEEGASRPWAEVKTELGL